MSYQLSTQGRKVLTNFMSRLHLQVGVAAGQQFSVEPSVAQQIVAKATDADAGWFLQAISAFTWVEQLKGEKVGLNVSGLISSRTNTATPGNSRTAKQVHGLSKTGYELNQINRDIALRYSTIDTWRHRPEFAALWAALVRQAMINDIIRVGWHGTHAAADTDPATYPNGEDVSRGWIKALKDELATQVDETAVTVGAGGDYANLDSLVFEAKGLIDERFRDDPGLRVMAASDLIQMAQGKYYAAQGDTPSEKNHLDGGRILETYGGLKAILPPFIKANHLVICNPKNLAHYIQTGSNRRTIKDMPENDQVDDFNSANEGYVVEEPRAMAVLTNVTEYVAP